MKMKMWRFGALGCLLLVLAGCASSKLGVRYPHAGATDAEISRDLVRLPQNLLVYAQSLESVHVAGQTAGQTIDQAKQAKRPLLAPEVQQSLAKQYVEAFYGPWKRQKTLFSANEAYYFVRSHPQGRLGYAENLRPVTREAWDALLANADKEGFPSQNSHGIAVANTALRAMPTHKPFFKSPEIAGEGYPFDYFSHAALWVGSPVYISHISADGLWFFVETQRVSGWVPVRDIALVSKDFAARWQAMPLGAVMRDGVVLSGHEIGAREIGARKIGGHEIDGRDLSAHSASPVQSAVPERLGASSRSASLAALSGSPVLAHVGTVLPMVGDTVFYPVRNIHGRALIMQTSINSLRLSPGTVGGITEKNTGARQGKASESNAVVVPFPQALTAEALARVGNEMMAQPYGWGGYLGNRDCSALMLDIFTPFGLWLPRNSGQQAKEGRVVSLAGMSAPQKSEYIRQHAKPFTTLIWLPGHIVLYVGEYGGTPAIYHDMWGVSIKDETGARSRAVIGKVAITSLSPGAELDLVASPASILDRMESLVFLGE